MRGGAARRRGGSGDAVTAPLLALPDDDVDEDCFDIAVVGGAAGRGAYFYGAGEPVTMPVED
jgi:hypothetical protein